MPNIPNLILDYINETTTQMMTTTRDKERDMSEANKIFLGLGIALAVGLVGGIAYKCYKSCYGRNEYENLSKEQINSKMRMKAIEESCNNTEYEAFATVGGY